ncbi:MAG: amidohydrolase family protein [Bacteroidota bacterium]|jgi:cytosine/adenosine deaminase-related metal-dependent hydrolase
MKKRKVNKLIIPQIIVTADLRDRILTNHGIEIADSLINKIAPLTEFDIHNYDGEVYNFENYTLVPGFVQTHIHLCQTLFRGLADDLELLDWLQKKIFPFENAHNKNSLKISVQLGLNELISGGTTTIVDMGTLRHQEVIFEELANSGIRAFAGKCMIDMNDLYPDFCESTKEGIESARNLAAEFHNSSNGKIKYAFAPRFVLTCSEKLLVETREMMNDFHGSFFHTHASENKQELEVVKKMHGKSNIEYFDSIGILNERAVLAHCIHLNSNEYDLLKNHNVRAAHCPSSNLKLGSGIANIPYMLSRGISVSLGADGAPCNNSLSAFREMNLAALIQKPIHSPTSMNAKTVFKLATIDGARALHMDNEIGSIEIGKKADLVLLDLEKADQPLNNYDDSVYSKIVYSSNKDSVKQVWIDGEIVSEKGICNIYDEQKLINDGKQELHKLINRS